jgi:hypothetical protein
LKINEGKLMNKILDWFKQHWQQRVFKVSTGCGVVLLYLEVFHYNALNTLIDNVIDNPSFITALVGTLTAYLFGTKKF